MNIQPSRHRTNGTRCHADHAHLHKLRTGQTVSLSAAEPASSDAGIDLHAIDDSASIQRALSIVINAVAAGTLDPARAKVLLYGLQIASANARRVAPSPKGEKIVHTVEASGDTDTLAAPAITGDADLSEPQFACADKGKHEERKHENTEVVEEGNQPAEAKAETTTSSTTSSGDAGIPPLCFNPAGGYSGNARARALAIRQRSESQSVV
jgi:hypothetical protein